MTQLIKSISIENLCSRRDSTIEQIQTASDLLVEANRHLEETGESVIDEGGFYGKTLTLANMMRPGEVGKPNLLSPDGVKEATELVDAQFWRLCLAASGMQSLMDAQARKEWEDNLNENKHPPFTRENVRATFAQLREQQGEIFDRGVINVFRSLSRGFRTNEPVKFGKRIIVTWFTHMGYINYEKCNELDDLNRVFHILDGKPEPDHRKGIKRQIYDAGNEGPRGQHDFEYFSIRWYKKGTAHLTFKRLDLVVEMNRILARNFPNALPPSDGSYNPVAEAEARRYKHQNRKADFFATPLAVAHELLSEIKLDSRRSRVLEPSAGEGALAKLIRHRSSCRLDLIEKNPERADALRQLQFEHVRCVDFLSVTPEPVYDYVVMNPPFSGGQDIDHVLHAFQFLRPGGELRAVVSGGALEGSRFHNQRFRDFCEAHGAEVEPLAPGAFSESGTNVRVTLLRIRKPLAMGAAA